MAGLLAARVVLSSLLLLTGLNPLAGDGSDDDGLLNRVRTTNRLATEAEAAYAQGRDAAAIDRYERLAALTPLPEEAQLTLAHAHFRAGHRTQARAAYAPLSSSATAARRAVALHQLGLLAAAERDYDRALPLLRNALRADPQAPAIRRSYETLARWLAAVPTDEIPPPDSDPGPARPQPRPDGQPSAADTRPGGPNSAPQGTGAQPGGGTRASANGDQEEKQVQGTQPGPTRGFGNQPGGTNSPPPRAGTSAAPAADDASHAQTLRVPQPDATISAAQARMLLEAMQAAETQYLQQLPRAPRPPADPTRPDW